MGKTPAQRAAKHGNNRGSTTAANTANTANTRPATGLQARLYPGTTSSSSSPAQNQRNANLMVIAGVVAVLFLFWYFHLLTLNQMTQLSDGLAMPDSLIGGYDSAYVETLRNAMNEDARGQLSYLHKTAGLLFPLFFALVWLLLIGNNISKRWLRRVLWVPPLLFAVVDIWENFAIDALFGTTAPDNAAVVLASALTVTRWVLLVLSVIAAAVALWLGWRHKRRMRRLHATDAIFPAGPAS